MALQFKYPHLELEFDSLHPEPRALVLSADKYVTQKAWHPLVLTHVFRTEKQSEELYWKHYVKRGYAEKVAREMARKRFSWHKVFCGVDIRNSVYTAEQLADLMLFLRDGKNLEKWELLSHDIGNGSHIHVGVRDESWRKTFTNKQ